MSKILQWIAIILLVAIEISVVINRADEFTAKTPNKYTPRVITATGHHPDGTISIEYLEEGKFKDLYKISVDSLLAFLRGDPMLDNIYSSNVLHNAGIEQLTDTSVIIISDKTWLDSLYLYTIDSMVILPRCDQKK